MKKIIGIAKNIFENQELRKKILFTLGILVLYRFITSIPVPGVNVDAVRSLFQSNGVGQGLGVVSVLTGGGMERFSIALMGLAPYINASIITQLLTVVIPKMETLSKEGEQGRAKINKITRWLTLPLALAQSYGMTLLLNNFAGGAIVPDTSFFALLPIMLTVTAGTILLMWLGEMIQEKGIGNGISIIIFGGIIAGIPSVFGGTLNLSLSGLNVWLPFVIMFVIMLALTYLIVMFTEGQRNIPISYAGRQSRGLTSLSAIPLRVNMAGMIPIIFAISILTFPSVAASFFQNATTPWVAELANKMVTLGTNQQSYIYMAVFFLLCLGFAFFYVSITFNPTEVADNIQKRGGYITGIRPGKATADYLSAAVMHLTLFGGLFIGFVGVFPLLLNNGFIALGQSFAGISFGSVQMLIGGAGLLIVVGVVLDVVRQIKTQMVMNDYDKFI